MPEEKAEQPQRQGEAFPIYQLICDALHILEAQDVCVTVSVPRLDRWYEQRVGVPVTVAAWPEIERVLVLRINELKDMLKQKQKRVIMRVVGPCREWLAMKLYKTLYPHADAVQYIVDGVIDI
jgi:hypothetical protein